MLFRLLRALLEEMFSPPKQAQPRRRVRTSEPTVTRQADSMRPAGPADQAGTQPSMETLLAQMFGLETEPEREESTSAPMSEPVPQSAPVRQDLSTYTGAATPPPAPRARNSGTVSRRMVKVPAEEKTPAALTKPGRNAIDLAIDLRKNPDAARQAFIYSEIFGPPLADR